MGGIGSGKSFIAKLFRYPVFNADKVVSKIYRKDKNCFKKLKKKFPSCIKSFPIKKTELVKIISYDRDNLKKISSVVHPIVRKKMSIFLRENRHRKMVILDIPLLIENKINKKNDILLFVNAKKKIILKRIKQRKNYNKKIFNNLKQNQYSLLRKRKLANYTIDNNFSINIMRYKVKLLKNKIIYERISSWYRDNGIISKGWS